MAKPKGRHKAALCPAPDSPGRQERKLMMQLKEVVDHQRDKIRAQDHEIQRKARDTEAVSASGSGWRGRQGCGASHLPTVAEGGCGSVLQLQEQLNRFMTMNENLRRKLAVVQAQLRSALERKGEVEALWEAERRGRAAEPARTGTPTVSGTEEVRGGRAKRAWGQCNLEGLWPPGPLLRLAEQEPCG